MIFAAGYHASGKSYMASKMCEYFPTAHLETSAIVRGEWVDAGSNGVLQEWAAEKEAEFGDEYFDEIIAQAIDRRYEQSRRVGSSSLHGIVDLVVTGNRSLNGIEFLESYFQETELGELPSTVIAMHADKQMLWNRFKARDRREGDATISFDDFCALTEVETRRGIEDIFNRADYHFVNNGDPETLERWVIDLGRNKLNLGSCALNLAEVTRPQGEF